MSLVSTLREKHQLRRGIKSSLSDNVIAFNIFPNPNANGELFTIVNLDWKTKNVIMIFNAQGTLVYSQKLVSETTLINANLAPGIYLVKVGEQTKKLVV